MSIFGFSPGVCLTEPSNLVFSLECLVSNGRRALLGDIRLGGSATLTLVLFQYFVKIPDGYQMEVLQWSFPRGVRLVINQLMIPMVLEASPEE